ncbi:MAG: A/G-specific adenine glycosylase [Bacteroidales bacterium]|jgi:A/G-specific adenine glycosylase|nr:A/G-specific adenine glycosylase [Bacteroidales bacterium]
MKKTLSDWFLQHKRDLPWRHTKDPYLIWLSEVILQQTQVVQGLPYYEKFVEKYPKIEDLANASEDEVLKLWQGLGYYSRARNLHKTAKLITEKYNGQFPNTYAEIRVLPGIGDYTAAAIASFAFDLCYPVLDGNVSRAISRMCGVTEPIDTPLGKSELIKILNKHIDKKNPAEFNQAIMEFGAMVCKPRQSLCSECVFQKNCYAFHHDVVETLPIKKNKTAVKPRRLDYLVCIERDEIWIKKRTEKDIWQGLYDFPETDTSTASTGSATSVPTGVEALETPLWTTNHQLSHQKLSISFWKTEKLSKNQKSSAQKIKISQFFEFATPIPINKFAIHYQHIAKSVEKKVPNVKIF